jgi:hypothetical protein
VPFELKDWTDRVFGRPVTDDFHRLSELEEACGHDTAALLRLAEVFEEPVSRLRPYSDESLDQAFWDLGSTVFSALQDESIEWTVRHRLIRSFEPLFRELFAARCQPVLGHLSQEGSALNSSCYMWWDFDCWWPREDVRSPLDSACLAAIRTVLGIDHVACQESALHGLGHWQRTHPPAVEGIIDEFLEREPHLLEELRVYAQAARAGLVL